jgi:histidine triad (HIT) family protein
LSELAHEPSCSFCEIVNGSAVRNQTYQGHEIVAFMDTAGCRGPCPRRAEGSRCSLSDLDELLGAHMFKVGHRHALALRRSGLRCEGVNILLADGTAAGQEVPHVHLHVFPRFAGDGFRIVADARPAERAQLDATADALRHGLRAR